MILAPKEFCTIGMDQPGYVQTWRKVFSVSQQIPLLTTDAHNGPNPMGHVGIGTPKTYERRP